MKVHGDNVELYEFEEVAGIAKHIERYSSNDNLFHISANAIDWGFGWEIEVEAEGGGGITITDETFDDFQNKVLHPIEEVDSYTEAMKIWESYVGTN